MKLPNADSAIVEPEKVRGYPLNSTHRYGASKAKFFESLGFNSFDWNVLAESLHRHALDNDVAGVRQTEFGPQFEVEGGLDTPEGRSPRVRSVWQIDEGQIAPRLITAYPV